MGKWVEVVQCNDCGKIHEVFVPRICPKCGNRMAVTNALVSLFEGKEILRLENAKHVIAKKKLFGWEVKQDKQ